MKKEFKIYTVGKMKGISIKEQNAWRMEIEEAIKYHTDMLDIPVQFVHPSWFYEYDRAFHKTEREVYEWELNQLADSDIVIVNLDGIEDSVGSHMELGFIEALNQYSQRHIYVIAIGKMPEDLHPWLKEVVFRHETNIEDAAEYIVDYLLV